MNYGKRIFSRPLLLNLYLKPKKLQIMNFYPLNPLMAFHKIDRVNSSKRKLVRHRQKQILRAEKYFAHHTKYNASIAVKQHYNARDIQNRKQH
jgi:hypothetical protein